MKSLVAGLVLSLVSSVAFAGDSIADQLKDQLKGGKARTVYLYTNKHVRTSDLSIAVRKEFGGMRPSIYKDDTEEEVRTVYYKGVYKDTLIRFKIVIRKFIPISERTH